MTKRFDRTAKGSKLHMQSLGAIAHFDYNPPAGHSYEQAIQAIRKLGLPREDLDQQVLRAIFNVVGRNHDDHVKNIAFLMNRQGKWRLSPAFDVVYAWDPRGEGTSRHQMSVNGKRDRFEREDFIVLARAAGIKKARANKMVDHVLKTVRQWPNFAEKVGVSKVRVVKIQASQRTNL